MARLRGKLELERRGRRFRYWRAPVRMCQDRGVALVKFADQEKPLRLCEHHLEREVLEHPELITWFEELYLSLGIKPPRERSAALDVAERFCINRAPTERSYGPLEGNDRGRRRRSA